MTTWSMAYHVVARHGYAIERLKRDMTAEPSREHLVAFLAYDAANFVWAFLLASGNLVCGHDRTLRDELDAAINGLLAKHGITPTTFVLRPEINTDAPLGNLLSL